MMQNGIERLWWNLPKYLHVQVTSLLFIDQTGILYALIRILPVRLLPNSDFVLPYTMAIGL